MAVGAELRVSVLRAYTRILPALSVAGVPTTPKFCQNLTRDLCFHVNICFLVALTRLSYTIFQNECREARQNTCGVYYFLKRVPLAGTLKKNGSSNKIVWLTVFGWSHKTFWLRRQNFCSVNQTGLLELTKVFSWMVFLTLPNILLIESNVLVKYIK